MKDSKNIITIIIIINRLSQSKLHCRLWKANMKKNKNLTLSPWHFQSSPNSFQHLVKSFAERTKEREKKKAFKRNYNTLRRNNNDEKNTGPITNADNFVTRIRVYFTSFSFPSLLNTHNCYSLCTLFFHLCSLLFTFVLFEFLKFFLRKIICCDCLEFF